MKIKSMAEISLFAVLSAVGARIMIPVPFVPFTLQTLVCMLAGFALGARKGAASQLLYMLMGLVGIPVFTSAAGPAAVFMPSFGYIPGFVCCAWICGALAERMRARCDEPGFASYFAAALLGVAATYAVGVAYLYVILNFWVQQEGATFFKVLSIGFLSTAGGDVVKAAVAATAAVKLAGAGIGKQSAEPYASSASKNCRCFPSLSINESAM